MAEFRAGLIANIGADALPDESIGLLLDLLKYHDGALAIEADRITLTFSFDSPETAGWAPGVVQGVPRLAAIARTLLVKSGIDPLVDVVGFSLERLAWPIEQAVAPTTDERSR